MLVAEHVGMVKVTKVGDMTHQDHANRSQTVATHSAFPEHALSKCWKLARRSRIHRQWKANGQDGSFDEIFEKEEKQARLRLGMAEAETSEDRDTLRDEMFDIEHAWGRKLTAERAQRRQQSMG